jgi:hypothetical protein
MKGNLTMNKFTYMLVSYSKQGNDKTEVDITCASLDVDKVKQHLSKIVERHRSEDRGIYRIGNVSEDQLVLLPMGGNLDLRLTYQIEQVPLI